MAELMINLRFSEPQHYIQLDVNCATIAPASELLYECKVQGPYYHSTSYLKCQRGHLMCQRRSMKFQRPL